MDTTGQNVGVNIGRATCEACSATLNTKILPSRRPSMLTLEFYGMLNSQDSCQKSEF